MRSRVAKDMKLEIFRKSLHVLSGVVIVLLVHAGLLTVPVLGLLALVSAFLVLFNMRYEKELLTHILSINRADAKVPGIELVSYLFGSWIVLILFPQQIAFAAIMILAFGDPVAHLVSTGFGNVHATVSRQSYLYGTLAAIAAGTLAAWLPGYVRLFPAFIASLLAMLVEAGELRIAEHHIDDNFTIPLVAAAVLWVISLV